MKIIPRRPYRDEEPDGYLESDRDFVLNNLDVALAMLEPGWSKEWPTEPGYYWFYGWTWCDKSFRITNNKPPKPHLVEVNKTSGDSRIYITKGNFMYKSERHVGLWTPAFPPEAPDLSESGAGLEEEEE